MSDLLGDPVPEPIFRDIRNTRPSSAEEKAVLLLRLGELINRCPTAVRDGSVNITREWIATRTTAAKLAKNVRASVGDLTRSISAMERFL